MGLGKLVFWGFALAMSVSCAVAGDTASQEDLVKRAKVIRPTEAELRWQQIPWLDSLAKARDTAQKEKRPVLVWTLDEDPFERC